MPWAGPEPSLPTEAPRSDRTNRNAVQDQTNGQRSPNFGGLESPDVGGSDGGGPTSTQNGRGSISSFLFMTVILFMMANGGGDDTLVRSQYRDSLRNLRAQQGNFSTWLWGGGDIVQGNETQELNFTIPETDQSSVDLAHSVMGFGVPVNPSLASYYSNITGFLHGSVQMYNLTTYSPENNNIQESQLEVTNQESAVEQPLSSSPLLPPSWAPLATSFIKDINITEAFERIGTWNWSAPSELAFRVLEKRPIIDWDITRVDRADDGMLNESVWSDVSLMHGRIEISDKESGDELGFDLEAVHFLENGTIYGFAEPAGRHVDVRDLPSLVPVQCRNATAQAVDAELLMRIKRLQEMIDSGVMEVDPQTSDDVAKTTCPFTVYAQLVPTSVPLYLMQELESEMDNPTGITTVPRPDLKMNVVMISKACGILLEVQEAEGLKSPRFWRKVTNYSATAALVYLVMLWLFLRQTTASQTPAGISRVSRWTFLTQAAADSISFIGHVTFGVLADGRPSLSLIAPAFLASILLIYEAQLSILIHQIQQPEEAPAPAPRPPPQPQVENSAPSQSPQNAAPALNAGAAPGPSMQTSTSLVSSLVTRIWQNMRESPQARFWLCMLAALALFVRVLVSPSLALFTIACVYGNFWIPQIVRSAKRGTSSGLRAEYLLGMTACRSFFALYLFACPKNVLGVDPSSWIFALIGFMFLQVFVILLQEQFGPGFFLPKSYTPAPAYDYHPPLARSDAEAPDSSLGDCAICMDTIVVTPSSLSSAHTYNGSGGGFSMRKRSTSSAEKEKAEQEKERDGGGVRRILDRVGRSANVASAIGGGGAGVRKNYALAPCHHLFHTACLERWLAIKSICPQCRRPLPPL